MPEVKSERLIFRMSEAGRRRLERAAKLEGLTLSEWLRRLALLRAAEVELREEEEQTGAAA